MIEVVEGTTLCGRRLVREERRRIDVQELNTSGLDRVTVVVVVVGVIADYVGADVHRGGGVEERHPAVGGDVGGHEVGHWRLIGDPVDAGAQRPELIGREDGEERRRCRFHHGDVHHDANGSTYTLSAWKRERNDDRLTSSGPSVILV
ncbi:MAG: hypothetical protein ABIR32_23415 [Ilumatobacteraceae bacterium]